MSSYQNASVLHDMNVPIPATLCERFSTVIDGASLEHVFNFPCAVANCILQMVRVDGHFLGINPANNMVRGHGFYQLSPELYFRVFQPNNGFRMERVIVFQDHWPEHRPVRGS